jgi:ankyrin repeat protein
LYSNALEAAAEEGHSTILRMLLVAKGLLSKPSDANFDDGTGGRRGHKVQTSSSNKSEDVDAEIALTAVSESGNTESLKILLQTRVNLNTTVSRFEMDTRTPLARASLHGQERAVQIFLDAGAGINFCSPTTKNETPLQSAASEGQERIVQVLIDAGADIDACDGIGGTALQAASESGHDNIVGMLLNSGADPMLEDNDGRSALVKAIGAGHDKLSQKLWGLTRNAAKRDVYRLALVDASERGQSSVVRRLLDAIVDVNYPGVPYRRYSYGEPLPARGPKGSALHAAASNGHNEIVRTLLDVGADLNARDSDGNSALDVALQRQHGNWRCKEIVQMLREAGANSHS